jgi:hypothetical protein
MLLDFLLSGKEKFHCCGDKNSLLFNKYWLFFPATRVKNKENGKNKEGILVHSI